MIRCPLMIATVCVVLACLSIPAAAADQGQDPRIGTFDQTLQTNDYTAKKQALRRVMAVDDDDAVYAALVRAAQDRQMETFALSLLRQRSGLQPATGSGGNPGYPGFPATDTPGGWAAWNQARLEEQRKEAELAAAKELAQEAKVQAAQAKELATDSATAEAASDTSSVATTPADRTQRPPEAAGTLDRVIFTDGSILLCYIIAKRIDLDGDLTSITIRHRQGGGEEDIDAAIIARVEEDVR
jgi:hypothetical protein